MAQIGTIRVETQNDGTVDVPVFDTGDSGSDVYEFVRVQTEGGTGFIPVVDPADASFPYLRVQSQNNGVVAVHDEAQLINILSNYLEDDWNDGSYSRPRTGQEDGTYTQDNGDTLSTARVRPNWDELAGDISVSDGELQIDDGDAASTSCDLYAGRWKWDWQTANGSNMLYSFFFIADERDGVRSANKGYLVQPSDAGSSYDLQKRGGSESFKLNASWGNDQDTHTSEVTRDENGNMEFFLDGASKGSGTDNEFGNLANIIFIEESDNRTNFDNIIVE